MTPAELIIECLGGWDSLRLFYGAEEWRDRGGVLCIRTRIGGGTKAELLRLDYIDCTIIGRERVKVQGCSYGAKSRHCIPYIYIPAAHCRELLRAEVELVTGFPLSPW